MSTSSTKSLRKAAIALIAGALITAIGGAVAQLVQTSTAVSDEMWSYPWSSETLVPISLLWALSHVLVFVGLLGFRRSGLAGPSRPAVVGLALTLSGTALLVVAELASIPIRDQNVDDTGPAIVGAVFGVATLLSAIGLLLVGRATMQAQRWRDWRRFTPLLAGLWAFALLGLAPTKALSMGVGIYGLFILALGIALYTRPSTATDAPASAQVQGA